MTTLLHNRGHPGGWARGRAYYAGDRALYQRGPLGNYLSLAIASIGISLALQLLGRKHSAQFVGQWVPTILILGLSNKMVKQHGSD
jgi:hypothetical protein